MPAGIALGPTLLDGAVSAALFLATVGVADFMGIAMSITAFPALARILTDRQTTHTPQGAMAVACAAIADVLARALLAVPYLLGMLFVLRRPCAPPRGVAVGGKFIGFIGVFAAARLNRMPPRGLTELIVLNVGLQLGFLGQDLYSLMVVMAVLTTAMTGPLLNWILGLPKADDVEATPYVSETPGRGGGRGGGSGKDQTHGCLTARPSSRTARATWLPCSPAATQGPSYDPRTFRGKGLPLMTTDASAGPSPQEFIDQRPIGRRQRLIVAVGLLTMVAEGLDTSVVAFVYPRIKKDWGTDLSLVTATVTLSVLAMIVGGAAAGPLADRYGRKVVTLVGTAAFGLGTVAMGFTDGIGLFAGLRVLACLGLGAVLPTVMVLVADWMPAGRRVQMVALAFAGVTAGTALGGILASVLIPAFGWHTLLVVCGIVPLLLIPVIVRVIPESVSVLAARKRPPAELRGVLEAVVPGEDLSHVDWDQSAVRKRSRPTPRVVLSRDFARTTLLLWLCFFLGQGVAFVIITYLPLLAEREGLTDAKAAVSVAAFGWGGLIGQLSVSFVLKRFDRFRVLAALWVMTAVGLGAAALTADRFVALLATAFLLGLCLPAATSVLQATTAVAYPPSARATGVSWANSVGKVGPLVGGLLGGIMVDAGWSLATVLLVLAAPVGAGLLATLALPARRQGQQAEVNAAGPRPLPGLASERQ